MKKQFVFILILIMILGFASCESGTNTTNDPSKNETTNLEKSVRTKIIKGDDFNGFGIRIEYFITEIDGCEYVATCSDGGRSYTLTHKGNCKYCAERKSNLSYMDSTSF